MVLAEWMRRIDFFYRRNRFTVHVAILALCTLGLALRLLTGN